MKLSWYVNRLKAMSPSEIAARLDLAVKKRSWRNRTDWTAPTPTRTIHDLWQLPTPLQVSEAEKEALLHEADRYLQGDYEILNLSFQESPIDWHRDHQSGVRAPLSFGLDLNYRDAAIAGNVKNIWDKSRHHHLTVLALAYALTHNEQYAKVVAEQLTDWVKNNPFPLGVNWTSSLEFGIRLISWVWIERLLRGSSSHDALFGQTGLLWSSIYWHQWMITQHYSHGSSANNHLIGEMAGLFIAATVWNVFPESAQWQALARKILEREVAAQTFGDGLNREQAFSYHIFSLEFFVLAGLEAERCSAPFSDAYRNWLIRMYEVIPQVADVGGNVPTYGDADNGMAVQLRPLHSSRTDWLFQLGRQWLGARVPLLDETAEILSASVLAVPAPVAAAAFEYSPGSMAFPEAGLYALSVRRGQPNEIFCLVDAGPLGFLSIAAHGHADALSFTLSVGGVPVIIDPGTYVYHADANWRSYFRGTRGHNTIEVDGVDQSEPGGTFLWTRKAKTTVKSWEPQVEGGVLIAEHDGYTRLPDPVVHRRMVSLEGDRLSIQDELLANKPHDVTWRLHFAPHCTATIQENSCWVHWDGGRLEIQLDPKLSWRLARGEAEGGWYSAGFNLKEPAFTLIGQGDRAAPGLFKHLISVHHGN